MSASVNLSAASAGELDGIEELREHGFEIAQYFTESGAFFDLRQRYEVPGLRARATRQHDRS